MSHEDNSGKTCNLLQCTIWYVNHLLYFHCFNYHRYYLQSSCRKCDEVIAGHTVSVLSYHMREQQGQVSAVRLKQLLRKSLLILHYVFLIVYDSAVPQKVSNSSNNLTAPILYWETRLLRHELVSLKAETPRLKQHR